MYKDQIKASGALPALPNDKALLAALRPAYTVLRGSGQPRVRGRAMYDINEEQKQAADTMLKVDQSASSSKKIVASEKLH